jgi:hypothetical protein
MAAGQRVTAIVWSTKATTPTSATMRVTSPAAAATRTTRIALSTIAAIATKVRSHGEALRDLTTVPSLSSSYWHARRG